MGYRKYDLIAPCHFGLEAVLKREIYDLGYEIKNVEDGRIIFEGDEEAVVRANMCLRTAERILIKIGEFKAQSFEELFQGTKALKWEDYIPRDGRFWVTKASSIKSKLFSPSDIQSIMKKAMVDRLKDIYNLEWFSEDGQSFPIRVFIKNDVVSVGLDTTGDSLHKRGYRRLQSKAPIAENLAAALIMLSPWNKDRILVDPFCGSGTFPIEAALMAAGVAPGLNREFTAMNWRHIVKPILWKEVRAELSEEVDFNIKTDITGYDIDPAMIKIAKENARKAGVDKLIRFEIGDIKNFYSDKEYGFVITNPPYGERLEEKENLPELYKIIGERFDRHPTWSKYMITSYEDAEKYIGKKSDKNRKIYNGMIKTYFYSYLGPKPPKKEL